MLSFLDPGVALLHTFLTTFTDLTRPALGEAAVVAALVVVTIAVRVVLLPFAVAVHRADRARRSGESVSPWAGLGPALAQAPVLFLLYRLCVVPVVAGTPNLLATASVWGLPLTVHAPAALASGGVAALVVAGLLVAVLITSELTARQSVARLATAPRPVVPPGSAIDVEDLVAMQRRMARLMPYGTAVAVAFVPMAVSVYLLTSSLWLLAERATLPRVI